MKALDTNVLARFFIDDPERPSSIEAAARCRASVGAARAAVFATFDRRLFKRGEALASMPPIELLG